MDHCEKEKRKVNPRESANILSLITFSYVVGTFRKAFKHDLEEEDLYEVVEICGSKKCGNKLEEQWKLENKRSSEPSISKVMWKAFGWKYTLVCAVDLSFRISKTILEPYALTNLISYFKAEQTTMTRNDAYFYAVMLITIQQIYRIYYSNYVIWVQQLGVEIKTAFSSFLYRKALKLTPSAVSEISLGNIVTLITKDVQILRESMWTINDVVIGIVQIVVVCYLIFSKIGVASFVGIGILFSSLPFLLLLGKWINNLRMAACAKTDERLQVTQETLSTIRIIKMYTWEKFFGERINTARNKEARRMLRALFLRTVLILVGIFFSNLGFYTLIIAFAWMGCSSDATIVFYLLTNFNELKETIGISIPWSIGKCAELTSAMARIKKVITAEELQPTNTPNTSVNNPMVEVKEVTVHIGSTEILTDLCLKVDSGLIIVTGSVGSGKSSLLKTILQDYPVSKGRVTSFGTISYASQDPWLFPSSIRQNITFGGDFDEKRYREVIRVCALQYDFNLLENADETIVTDRGMNLSKGQQARINLARAIYKESDIYLLDDSLSALDAHVQDHIFKECVKSYLKDKIVILVSQTANHIDEADSVVIMDKGRIIDFGKPSGKILQEVKEIVPDDDDLEKEVIDDEDNIETDENTKLLETEQISTRKRIYKEVKKEGSVSLGVYKKYVIFGGGFLLLFVNIAFATSAQFTQSYSDKLLSRWVDEKQTVLNLEQNLEGYEATRQSMNSTLSNNLYNISAFLEAKTKEQKTFEVYSIMIFSATLTALITSYANFDFCRRASINIHKALVGSIIRAVMSFFDTHYIGNVLNRFSADLALIDENVPFISRDCLRTIFSIIGHLSLLLSVDIQLLVYILFVFTLLLILRRFCIPAARSLKRLEASSRSPMIGHLNASLEGLTTIRAYKAEAILIDEFDRHQDLYTSAHFTSLCSMRGFIFFMEIIGSTMVTAVIIKFLFFATDVSAGDVGLALTQVAMLGGSVQWGLRQWTELETQLTSLERVLEYTEITPEKEGGEVLDDWPSKGSVEYEDVSLAYNNETVLKNLSFEVEPKQRVGIVGRTGAGKSSLISSIFRLYDVQGKIKIDGVNIRNLSLKFLRKKLAIIPQDPVLFSGTARTNLDPFREFEDRDLWSVLEKVNLKKSISDLDLVISNASNFSSGQKQLFCLARALLRQTKILILDEATANMDHETDIMLHKIINQHFPNCTMFIIAHRLHTILECDKVMVLDRGAIVEFNEPLKLLENENGLFYKMVKQAGLLNHLDYQK
nr:probable multidrug resistance-associated protein lethal(2)03659 isoform X1 [Leptinotarsa decemlineata]